VLLIVVAVLWPAQPEHGAVNDTELSEGQEQSEPQTERLLQPRKIVSITSPETAAPINNGEAEIGVTKADKSTIEPSIKKTPTVQVAPTGPSVKTPVATAKVNQSGSYIQVGSFKHAGGAAKVADTLKAHGWPVIIASRSAMHAVQVGPYSDKKSLESARQQLKIKEKLDGFVVRH